MKFLTLNAENFLFVGVVMRIKFEDLELLSMLSKCISLSDASLTLDIPQPTLSRRVKRLESNVGQRIFNRGRAPSILTDFGKMFIGKVEPLLQAYEDVDSFILQTKQVPEGLLTIEAEPVLADLLLGGFVQQFKTKYPKIGINIITLKSDAWHTPLDKGIRIIANFPSDEGLVAKPFVSSYVSFYAAPELIARNLELRHPTDLQAIPCVLWDNGKDKLGTWSYQENGFSRELELVPDIIVDNGQRAKQAAVSGLGVISSPELVVRAEVESGKLTELFLGAHRQQVQSYIVFRDRQFLPLHERLCIDELDIFMNELPQCVLSAA
ncbi:LysR family transcriptional regulator [Alginatibacterium sediminis]|uniref:LysR family transcriptional regulator n=1 Tax=Alginatibacterium sediminis TaxID=2164068 RepID=A0A420E6J4_9ALTE|nr:LysR family transcriptional regulator [Alginatibacterium sediminis]RKF13701.1 LysR family transcriptional regulator [Alginatibacterium sediminis]